VQRSQNGKEAASHSDPQNPTDPEQEEKPITAPPLCRPGGFREILDAMQARNSASQLQKPRKTGGTSGASFSDSGQS
jgi:hypothetical protein